MVDPDVDRLAMFCEDGTMYGEEYTLVTWQTIFCSTRRGKHGCLIEFPPCLARCDPYVRRGNTGAAAVGEVNVVAKMKETRAVIGGEATAG